MAHLTGLDVTGSLDMVSSSVSVTAAAHLSPLVDYADLDGNLLISNDPFHGVRVKKGKLMFPKRPAWD